MKLDDDRQQERGQPPQTYIEPAIASDGERKSFTSHHRGPSVTVQRIGLRAFFISLIPLMAIAIGADCDGWSADVPRVDTPDELETSNTDLDFRTSSGFGRPLRPQSVPSPSPFALASEYYITNEFFGAVAVLITATEWVRPNSSTTPLHRAAICGNQPNPITALLQTGSDANVRAEFGVIPIHLAARHNENIEIIATLINGGADVNLRSEFGLTALHGAAGLNRNPNVILIDAGADINARDVFCATPLHWAAKYNYNPAVTRALVRAGARPNARSEARSTPLHWAAGAPGSRRVWVERAYDGNKNPDVVTTLVGAGSRVDVRDDNGRTALHLATKYNNSAVVTALLDAGADPNAEDDWNKKRTHQQS